eukprot:scaffold29797_cov118-Isochrysis_galbana.AAC.2
MKKTSRLPPTIPYNTSPTRSPGQEMAIAALGDDLADLRYNHHTDPPTWSSQVSGPRRPPRRILQKF